MDVEQDRSSDSVEQTTENVQIDPGEMLRDVFFGVAGVAGKAVDSTAKAAVAGAEAAGDVIGSAANVATTGAKQIHQMFGGEYGDEFGGNLRNEDGSYVLPDPLVDKRELEEINALAQRYDRLLSPGFLEKTGKTIADVTPKQAKQLVGRVGDAAKGALDGLTKQELIGDAIKVATEGFGKLEEQAAKSSIGSEYVLQRINVGMQGERVSQIPEICLLRSYDVAKISNDERLQHMGIAFVEGAGTGAVGFWGIPANLALSMLIYFRAVQSVAMFYGYDVKNDPAELVIAGDVFSKAMAPGAKGNPANDYVGKILVYAESATVKQAAKKGWQAMVEAGGAALAIAQMRGLANKAAQKAVEKGGQKAVESSVFKNVLKQVGTKLSLKSVARMVPVIGAGFGALFDTGQMSKVLEFADIFYHKRFILEKPERIQNLTGTELLPDGEDGAMEL